MKRLFKFVILILFLVINKNNIFSQTPVATVAKDSTKVSDSTKLEQVSSQLSELIDRMKNAANSEKENVGVIEYDNTIPAILYIGNPRKKTGRTILIDRVSLLLKDGYIVEIQVFSGQKKFTNELAPITVNATRFSKKDYLQNENDKYEFIVLQEVLSFTSFNSFFPNDELIWLTPSHKADTLSKNVGVNSVLDLRLYTDALGILGKTPNGIIQTDVRFKQFIHRKNRGNSGKFFGQYIKFNFNATKFDSKRNFEDSSNFSRTGLMQEAVVNAELAYNIFNDWVEKKSLSSVYVDIGGGISISQLARLKDTISITTQNIFTEGGLNLRSSSNIGIDVYVRAILQYSPQTDFNDQARALWYLRFGGEVYWNPFGDIANRIFGRVNYTFSTKNIEKKAHYSQIQLGYSVLLTKLVGKK